MTCSPFFNGQELRIGILAMFHHEEAHVLHVWPVVMNHEARSLFSPVEVLVPREHRNTKRVAFLPVNALILDDGVTVA